MFSQNSVLLIIGSRRYDSAKQLIKHIEKLPQEERYAVQKQARQVYFAYQTVFHDFGEKLLKYEETSENHFYTEMTVEDKNAELAELAEFKKMIKNSHNKKQGKITIKQNTKKWGQRAVDELTMKKKILNKFLNIYPKQSPVLNIIQKPEQLLTNLFCQDSEKKQKEKPHLLC